ncbi:uncharacterized protein FN964_011786 isoform 3-T5 [Alca torda]
MPPGEGRGAAGWPPSRPGGASSEHPRVLGREAVERLVFSEITVILKTSCFSAGPLSRSLPPEAAVLTVSDICCPLRGVHSFLLTEWAEYNLIYFILILCSIFMTYSCQTFWDLIKNFSWMTALSLPISLYSPSRSPPSLHGSCIICVWT